jgi:hypothetical protein
MAQTETEFVSEACVREQQPVRAEPGVVLPAVLLSPQHDRFFSYLQANFEECREFIDKLDSVDLSVCLPSID